MQPRIATGGPQPCSTAVATGADTFAGSSGNLAYRAGYTADLLASVYGFSGLYQAGDEGAGQTIAVVDEEPYLSSDIATYQSCYQTAANVSNVPVGSGVGTTLPSDDEAALDIETAISTAPEAAILVYRRFEPAADPPADRLRGPREGHLQLVGHLRELERSAASRATTRR